MIGMRRRISLFVLCFSVLAHAQRPPSVSPAPQLPTVIPGLTVTVAGNGFPAKGVKVFLRTGIEKPGDMGILLDAVVAADGKSLTFRIPKNHFAPGRYFVFLSFDSTEIPVPGELRVVPDEALNVTFQ